MNICAISPSQQNSAHVIKIDLKSLYNKLNQLLSFIKVCHEERSLPISLKPLLGKVIRFSLSKLLTFVRIEKDRIMCIVLFRFWAPSFWNNYIFEKNSTFRIGVNFQMCKIYAFRWNNLYFFVTFSVCINNLHSWTQIECTLLSILQSCKVL